MLFWWLAFRSMIASCAVVNIYKTFINQSSPEADNPSLASVQPTNIDQTINNHQNSSKFTINHHFSPLTIIQIIKIHQNSSKFVVDHRFGHCRPTNTNQITRNY